jgi:response regulator RpfG family c-di-GMP phosphodiesterase
MQENRYRTVLVVDDNEIDNIITKKYLQGVLFAGNIIIKLSAMDGLHYLKNVGSEEDIPDIIFLDIRMPEMDGFEFLEEYENVDNSIKDKCKIIMISSSLDYGDISKALSNRYVHKFLIKPLKKDELKKIRDFLDVPS